MDPIFNELDHRLSVVKRWGILHTIQQQSVAEHVHNVTRIALRIAQQWFGEYNPNILLAIVTHALHHEDEETLTGDMPTMVKPYFDSKKFINDHKDLLVNSHVLADKGSYVHRIVKIADKMEGYHFLCMEVALGNDFVAKHLEAERDIILSSLHLDVNQDDIREKLSQWMENQHGLTSTRFGRAGQ